MAAGVEGRSTGDLVAVPGGPAAIRARRRTTAVPEALRGRVASHLGLAAGVVALAAAPFVLMPFDLSLLGQFLAFGIAAMGLDLLWGYGGMLSLAQGTFFSLGAYCMAMYLKLVASGKALPDFMVWNSVSRLPGFWEPFHSLAFAAVASVVVPGVLAGIMGLLIFRQRVRGVYFAILTQALCVAMATLFIGDQGALGGFNGITDFKSIFGVPLGTPQAAVDLYGATAAGVVAVYALCRWLVHSRFGRLLVAIRDGENRVRYCGYDPAVYKAFAFAVASALAGLGGALYVGQIGLISPAEMGVVPSIELVILVAVGGRGTIAGALVGAVLVKFLENGLNSLYPAGWQFLLGGLFIVAVVAMPRGLAPLATLAARWRPSRGAVRERGGAMAAPTAVSRGGPAR